MARVFVVALLILASADRLCADIFEWRDDQNVRHFTNVREDVPAQYRPDTRVVARERGDVASATGAEAAPSKSQTEPRLAQVVYDPRALHRAYEAGVADGLQASDPSASPSAPLQVLAPVAIANAPSVSIFVPDFYPWYPRSSYWAGLPSARRERLRSRLETNGCRGTLGCDRAGRVARHFPFPAAGPAIPKLF